MVHGRVCVVNGGGSRSVVNRLRSDVDWRHVVVRVVAGVVPRNLKRSPFGKLARVDFEVIHVVEVLAPSC